MPPRAAWERRAARRRMAAVVQALPHFRDRYASEGHTARASVGDRRGATLLDARSPPSIRPASATSRSRIRNPAICSTPWRGGRDGASSSASSVAARRSMTGEGGLAGWSEALARRPAWQIVAPTAVPHFHWGRCPPDAFAGLAGAAGCGAASRTPVRAVRAPHVAAWVDAVLADRPADAVDLAKAGLPFRLTRSLADSVSRCVSGAPAPQV